jgi:hypothetical protein
MISTTDTLFRGLQQSIHDNIRLLPDDIAPEIKEGLNTYQRTPETQRLLHKFR